MHFSLRHRKLVALIFSVGLISGCSKEDAPYFTVQEMTLSGSDCLSNIPDQISKYFKAEATESEVSQVWVCLQDSLKQFGRRYRPSDNRSYTAEELRGFLEEFFVDKDKLDPVTGHFIPDELLDEMMGVKKLVLGGSRRRLTHTELERSFAVFREMNEITQILRPHIKLILMKDKEYKPSLVEYNLASNSLKRAAARFFALLGGESSNYEMRSLQRLLREMDLFIAKNSDDGELSEIDKYVPVFAAAKSLLTNSSDRDVAFDEWRFLGELIASGLDSYLRTRYFFRSDSLSDVNALFELDSTIQSFFDILKVSAGSYQEKTLPVVGIDKVVKELAAINELPLDFTYEDMQPIVRLFFDKILNPKNQFPLSGLSDEKISFLQNELNDWVKVQELLISNGEEKGRPVWEEMLSVLNTPFSANLDDLDRIVIDGESRPAALSASTRFNWLRGIFKILFSVYSSSDSDDIFDMTLTEAELTSAVADLHNLLVGFDLIAKNDDKFAEGMFRDASLFMPRSDGNMTVNFIEVVEYIHFVIAGINAGNIFLNNLNPDCKNLDEKIVDVTCFRRAFPAQSENVLSHMPHLLKFTRELDDEKLQKIVKNLEIINRSEGYVNTPILENDIKESFVLLQYIEVVMMRFDRDRSGYLNLIETLRMLDLFKEILGDLLGLDVEKDKDEIEILFTYMLNYGSIPDPIADPLADIRYKNWTYQKGKWKLAISRGTLLQLLATINKLQ